MHETPRSQAEPRLDETKTTRQHPNADAPFVKGIYVSADDLERAAAREMGYETVCLHPNEACILAAERELVIDFDHVLFGDFDAAVRVAVDAARCGMAVGIHTYNPGHLPLATLTALPRVTVARTHRELRAAMRSLKAAA